jgi:adenylate cyclase
MADGDNLLGDGVNVAARLEGLAEPGGICVRRAVRNQVRDKLPLAFEDLGEVAVKNIARPVRVFRVVLDSEAPRKRVAPIKKLSERWRWPAVAVAAVVLVLVVIVTTWFRPWAPEPSFDTSPLSAESSIAVLPFTNLSKNPEEDYFSDGITDDIITDLSKFHDLFVIASNSTFTYKGKPVDVKKVGRELGVRYVLEGSVQRSDKRVRINAQLIDVSTARHLWSERYEDAIDDIFDLQDRITRRVVGTLAVRLTDIELDRVSAKPTRNLEAYDYVLKGKALVALLTRAEIFEAREMFRRAIKLDPSYSSAYAGLGFTYLNAVLYGWAVSPNRAVERAYELAQKSLSLDGTNVAAHRLLGRVYVLRKQYDLAIVELERAIVLNPNDAASYAHQGVVLIWSSRPDGAILSLETALRFDPNMDMEGLLHLGLAYYLKGRYADAIRILERGLGRSPDYVYGHIVLAAAYGQTGRLDAAVRETEEVKRLDPFFEVEDYGRLFRDSTHAARVIEGLRKAGLE